MGNKKEECCARCGGPFKAWVMGSSIVYTAIRSSDGLIHWSPLACLEFRKKKEKEKKGS